MSAFKNSGKGNEKKDKSSEQESSGQSDDGTLTGSVKKLAASLLPMMVKLDISMKKSNATEEKKEEKKDGKAGKLISFSIFSNFSFFFCFFPREETLCRWR